TTIIAVWIRPLLRSSDGTSLTDPGLNISKIRVSGDAADIDDLCRTLITDVAFRGVLQGIGSAELKVYSRLDESGLPVDELPVYQKLSRIPIDETYGNPFVVVVAPLLPDVNQIKLKEWREFKNVIQNHGLSTTREHDLPTFITYPEIVSEADVQIGWCGEEIALKISDILISQHPEFKEELLNEVAIYNTLKELQGKYIPILKAAGYLWDQMLFGIATEI
ncbi:288_t:CDS:2, partial [Paraglomus occultum]